MKKLRLFFLFFVYCFILQAQEITYTQDLMTDKIYYSFKSSDNKETLLVSEDETEGFFLLVFFEESGRAALADKVNPRTIYAKLALNGVNCVEEGFMVIRFENGEKIQLNNWKDFNCDGEFYFNPGRNLEKLFSEKIDKIMIQDGRSYRSYTYKPDNPEFFIELGVAINKPYILVSEE